MPFINNIKMTEIRKAANEGNEQALKILQAMRKQEYKQGDIDRLVNDYYGVQENVPASSENAVEANFEPEKDVLVDSTPQEIAIDETIQSPDGFKDENPLEETVVDLTEVLDGEMEGLLDENELEDLSFTDFLGNKSRDNLRMSKNADYFKAYDAIGRENYMNSKIDSYKEKFNGRLGNIQRKYDDNNKALSLYMQQANDSLDDNIEFDMTSVNGAYKDFTEDENVMNSFGRHWDSVDNENIIGTLQTLIGKYGKKNVIAALNTINSDNDNYRDFLNNQIDTEIKRYSNSLEKLLK